MVVHVWLILGYRRLFLRIGSKAGFESRGNYAYCNGWRTQTQLSCFSSLDSIYVLPPRRLTVFDINRQFLWLTYKLAVIDIPTRQMYILSIVKRNMIRNNWSSLYLNIVWISILSLYQVVCTTRIKKKIPIKFNGRISTEKETVAGAIDSKVIRTVAYIIIYNYIMYHGAAARLIFVCVCVCVIMLCVYAIISGYYLNRKIKCVKYFHGIF